LKIAHLSDLHFSHFVLNPIQFLSKTWIGNANLLLKRGKILQPICAEDFGQFLLKQGVELVLISGDLSTTSQPLEFKKAKNFITSLETMGLKVLAVPGNHDHYTKKAFNKKLFYNFLSNTSCSSFKCFGELKNDLIEHYCINNQHIILLDLATYTPWFTAYGTFSSKIKERLMDILNTIPKNSPLIVVGHFPIVDKEGVFKHSLKHGDELLDLLKKHPNVTYLHGHDHKFNVLENKNGFYQVDAGSLSDTKKGSFSLIDLEKNSITAYLRENKTFTKGPSYERKMV
jgi:3',5'-cyclic AMP phosphodiesterase CpdA